MSARSLQFLAYLCTSMTTFWLYDYACTLHKEWTFLLRSRWTKIKGLYIVARYVPFIIFSTNLYLNFSPNENPDKCQRLNNIFAVFRILSVFCAECFFALRTYTLWNNNKLVLAAAVTAFLAVVVASISITFATTATAPFATSVVPGITGCYQSSSSFQLFIPFLLLLALELGLLFLTLIRAIQNWRTANGPLYVVLVKHNIFYYACGLFFSVVNVLTSLLLHHAYHAMFQDLQFFILAILATRMHLHLWQLDQHAHGSDALGFIYLSDIFPEDLDFRVPYLVSFIE
ncbi:hypothetical protein DEU56DRAFT_64965 [Suillus clintonianus]|uniref:uncharacterized protein n=1 Tax=Suillus clintonianus TaxID=1904413 RepID=UPI001B87FC42|nr:uncharacterized protein DEU56DRAFT_64965 [Suillus clintonianus]KAG2123068.1 hypothetical protein DEU56DRAFT_64965 [Suillus clintonianus]